MGRYLKGARQYGVLMRTPMNADRMESNMDGYGDTDYAGCQETRKSTSCGIIYLDRQPFLGYSRRQAVVSLSSGEKRALRGVDVGNRDEES